MKFSMAIASILCCWFLCLHRLLAEFFPPTSAWENVDYIRIIDLSRSYVRETHQVKVRNAQNEPLHTYYFAVPTVNKQYITLLIPTFEAAGHKMLLVMEELNDTFEELSFYKIEFPFPVAPKATSEFQVSMVLTGQLSPFPELVESIEEYQSLIYHNSKLPLTIYPTENYTLKFAGFQSTVDEIPVKGVPFEDKYKGVPQDDQLVYGPYDLSQEVAPVRLPMSLVFNRRAPLMHVNKLTREIWVSHWSELLQVEEHYELTNKGVALKNGFNRVEYMLKKMSMKLNPAINSIDIPVQDVETSDIYYTDLVGNVSTSMVMDGSLLLKPRFPVFGGWNYNFTIGWTNKLLKYVHLISHDEYLLKVPVINGPRDCSYSVLQFNVYLPEGAQVLGVESPIEYENYEVDHFYSYLDVFKGHTRVKLTFDNLVDEMKNIQVIVKYSYTTADQLAKVISISIYVFIALLSFIGIRLIDIRIDINKKKLN